MTSRGQDRPCGPLDLPQSAFTSSIGFVVVSAGLCNHDVPGLRPSSNSQGCKFSGPVRMKSHDRQAQLTKSAVDSSHCRKYVLNCAAFYHFYHRGISHCHILRILRRLLPGIQTPICWLLRNSAILSLPPKLSLFLFLKEIFLQLIITKLFLPRKFTRIWKWLILRFLLISFDERVALSRDGESVDPNQKVLAHLALLVDAWRHSSTQVYR